MYIKHIQERVNNMIHTLQSMIGMQSDTATLFIVVVVAIGFFLFCGAVVNAIKSVK